MGGPNHHGPYHGCMCCLVYDLCLDVLGIGLVGEEGWEENTSSSPSSPLENRTGERALSCTNCTGEVSVPNCGDWVEYVIIISPCWKWHHFPVYL